MADFHDDEETFGTVARDTPVTRADLERAIRGLAANDLVLKDQIMQLAAQLVTLTDELTRRLDGVEPLPAPADTPATPTSGTVENAVAARTAESLEHVRVADAMVGALVKLDFGEDKYEVTPVDPGCAERMHLCHARCCKFKFSLTTQDLDEGVVRFDYGRPYMIRQRESDGRCVHNDPTSHGCTVHAVRPRICRTYTCAEDPRIWIDYAARIPAPLDTNARKDHKFDLMERARARSLALYAEAEAIENSFPDAAPSRGPKPG